MSETVIKVENLSKQYRIGAKEGYKTFRETLIDSAIAPFLLCRDIAKKVIYPLPSSGRLEPESEENRIWALNKVSFEVKRGEVVGIIGRNGAGKSTLLKILSKITEPTEGRVELRGRVGSLLEVGTGFHPELTGHENVYLYGAILGMDRWEVTRKFDEIIAFAELEKFVDTPVKRYSSGMYMRLAFAVAAHLEPEILIVDEVLAVGDAAFQKKCLGKMGDVSKEGRTVLFVSHNMQAIRQLCHRALLLESGLVSTDGLAAQVVEKYLRTLPKAETTTSLENIISQLPPDPVFHLEGISLTQNGQPVLNRVLNGQPLEIEIRYRVLERAPGLRIFFDLCDSEDTLLFRSFYDEGGEGILTMQPGRYVSKAVIPADVLAPIAYELRVHVGIFNIRMCTPASGICIQFFVEATGRQNRAYLSDTHRGKLALAIPWDTKEGGD
jgi:lipopolysaccharide transport system ATP-binding protein